MLPVEIYVIWLIDLPRYFLVADYIV